jgi:Chaperone of endosialidase
MAYLGNSPVLSQQEYRNIDNISGSFNGVTTSFPLLVNGVAPVPAPQSSNQCLISVNGVVQKPDDTGASGFRLSGGNIVFSAAPTGGQSFFGVILAGADYVYSGSNFPDGNVSAPSITFAQDLDTGFYRSGAGEVKFTANGANVVTLSANNFTAPSFIPTSSTVPTNGVYLPSANNVAISTNGTGRLFVDANGRVALGGTTVTDSNLFNIQGSTATHNVGVVLNKTNGTPQVWGIQNGGSLTFFNYTSSTTALTIDTSNRVGLGTSSPASLLTSYPGNVSTLGAKASTGILVDNNGNAGNVSQIGLGYTFSSTYHPVAIAAITDSGSGSTRADLHFATRSLTTDSAPETRMIIKNDGKVGIGTNAAPGKLTVATTSADPTAGVSAWTDGYSVVSPGGTSTSGGIGFSFNTTANVGHISCATPGTAWRDLIYQALAHRFLSGASEVARINTSGVLLVGQVDTALNNATGTQIHPTQIVVHSSTSNGTLELGSTRAAVAADIGGQLTFRAVYRNSDSDSVEMAAIRGRRSNATINDWSSYLAFETTNSTTTSERMRLDNAGRLLVGTSTAPSVGDSQYSLISILGSTAGSTTDAYFSLRRGQAPASIASGSGLGTIVFGANDGSPYASIAGQTDGSGGSGDYPGRLVFSTTADGASSPTERMRITSSGHLKVSNTGSYLSATGTYHELTQSITSAEALYIRNTSASPYGITISYTGASPNGTINQYLYCFDGSLRAEIRSNGGIANYSANNVNLSDINTKKDIAPAAGTWDCLKEWEIVNFRYKDQPDDADLNMGVIAQQVAESCPEVITVFQEAKEATETEPAQEERLGVKDQQMMWMAIKALQEAQLRIETLEAEVAALKGA